MKKTTTTFYIMVMLMMSALSFQLGWSMRGDKIYGSMFSGTAAIAAKLPAAQGVK